MHRYFCFMALVAVVVAAGCPSRRQHHQHSYEPAGTAHATCEQPEIAPEVEEPSTLDQVPSPEDSVEVPVFQKSKPIAAPIKVGPVSEVVVPRSGTVYGHGEKYTWLIGKLRRVHVPGGEWKIRYRKLDELDRWGGSMVLAPDIRLEDFSDGDVIYVEGEILAARPSVYLAGPLYRIRTIRPVTTADRQRIAQANR